MRQIQAYDPQAAVSLTLSRQGIPGALSVLTWQRVCTYAWLKDQLKWFSTNAFRHGFHRQEEQDIFSAVGGMELGADAELDSLSADMASTSGHERHSEPSRTLFVRHINPSASDEELLAMFKVGPITLCVTGSLCSLLIVITVFLCFTTLNARRRCSAKFGTSTL